jgi:hypothetical protein
MPDMDDTFIIEPGDRNCSLAATSKGRKAAMYTKIYIKTSNTAWLIDLAFTSHEEHARRIQM